MPLHIINLRESSYAGGVTQDTVAAIPALTSSDLLLLIHGYNDGLMDAREAYASFLNPSYDRDLVRSLPPSAWMAYLNALQGDTLDSFARDREVCLVFWPGDVFGRTISAAAYVPEIEMARQSGKALATFLIEFAAAAPGDSPAQFTLICHSLGNRLGLEMVKRLNSSVPCRAMCLMAAAVAVSMATGFTLPDFSLTIGSIDKRLALYADSDSILSYAFPLGEAASGEGYDLEAIGHAGNPAGLWTERDDMHPYGHGDYWPAAASDIGTNSRDLILKFLGHPMASEPASSQLPTNRMPAAPSFAQNKINQHATPTHRLGS
jgi:hypothetical protein